MPSYDDSVFGLRSSRMNLINTTLGLTPTLNIYSSSAGSIPSGVDTVASSLNVLLAAVTITSSKAFGTITSGGVITANAFTAESAANATGTATYARFATSSGQAVCQFTAGSSVGNEIVLNSASISSGANVSVTSLTITEGNA